MCRLRGGEPSDMLRLLAMVTAWKRHVRGKGSEVSGRGRQCWWAGFRVLTCQQRCERSSELGEVQSRPEVR